MTGSCLFVGESTRGTERGAVGQPHKSVLHKPARRKWTVNTCVERSGRFRNESRRFSFRARLARPFKVLTMTIRGGLYTPASEDVESSGCSSFMLLWLTLDKKPVYWVIINKLP